MNCEEKMMMMMMMMIVFCHYRCHWYYFAHYDHHVSCLSLLLLPLYSCCILSFMNHEWFIKYGVQRLIVSTLVAIHS